jgi:hypothetical protein
MNHCLVLAMKMLQFCSDVGKPKKDDCSTNWGHGTGQQLHGNLNFIKNDIL